MNLRLSIFKREELNDYPHRHYIKFAVVDLEKSEEYPSNFVCILPKNIKAKSGYYTKFERRFGNKSLDLAKKLLKRSLKAEKDWEVKAEIRERLELLKPKSQRNIRKNRLSFRSFKNFY